MKHKEIQVGDLYLTSNGTESLIQVRVTQDDPLLFQVRTEGNRDPRVPDGTLLRRSARELQQVVSKQAA